MMTEHPINYAVSQNLILYDPISVYQILEPAHKP
jgi:hypothetical protein